VTYSFFKDHEAENRLFFHRALVVAIIMLSLVFLLLYRFYHLQVIEHAHFHAESDFNRIKLQPIPPPRGIIIDQSGVILADNAPIFYLSVVKELSQDLPQMLSTLAELIELPKEHIVQFHKRLKLKRRPYEATPLTDSLTESTLAKVAVELHRFPELKIEAELVRRYHHAELMAHVLGYVGRINEKELKEIDETNYLGTNYIGKTGIEKYYENILHGKVGFEKVETNARGRILKTIERTEASPGADIQLFLDLHTQEVAQEALGNFRGSIVAISPKTGGVIAAVSMPSFDANLFVKGIDSKTYLALNQNIDRPLFNRIINGQYPPGSTIKPFMGLAGLHHQLTTWERKISDPGFFSLEGDGHRYRDWKKGGHGWVDLEVAIIQSCDVYFYDLANKLKIDRMADFLKPFRFGTLTHVDLPNESSGLYPSREWKKRVKKQPWFPGETVITGIGQGYVLTTPMQMAVATAMLANKGHTVIPRFVHKINGIEPIAREVQPQITLHYSPDWDRMIQAMTGVIHTQRGTASRLAKEARYLIAGKTGTAQVFGIKQGEKYNEALLDKRLHDHAWFMAFAPAQDPEIAIAVIVENGGHGGSVAAPMAKKVMDAYLLDTLKIKTP